MPRYVIAGRTGRAQRWELDYISDMTLEKTWESARSIEGQERQANDAYRESVFDEDAWWRKVLREVRPRGKQAAPEGGKDGRVQA